MLIDVTLRYYFYCNQTNNQTSGITLYHEDFAIFLVDLYVFIYNKKQHTHAKLIPGKKQLFTRALVSNSVQDKKN